MVKLKFVFLLLMPNLIEQSGLLLSLDCCKRSKMRHVPIGAQEFFVFLRFFKWRSWQAVQNGCRSFTSSRTISVDAHCDLCPLYTGDQHCLDTYANCTMQTAHNKSRPFISSLPFPCHGFCNLSTWVPKRHVFLDVLHDEWHYLSMCSQSLQFWPSRMWAVRRAFQLPLL